MNNLEIERKWLVDSFPDLPVLKETMQEQGYLAFSPLTIRIRKSASKSGTSYVLCVKGQGGLVRTEIEQEISQAKYEALKQMLVYPMATKQHRTYRLPFGQTLECSLVDKGEPAAFYFAEVEFCTEEEAASFVPPAFLQNEVTGNSRYSMAAYCIKKAEIPEYKACN